MAQALFDILRTIPFASITDAYLPAGGPLLHTLRCIKFTNETNGDIVVSTDGVNDMIIMPAESFTVYDLSTNAPPIDTVDNLILARETQFYIKWLSEPSEGSFYIEGFYAKGE